MSDSESKAAVMGSARILSNDFSWSNSRHEKLRECLRAYYFTYYASWGGWERGAKQEIRDLYILKKLSNRFTWAGSVVHASIRNALRDIRAGLPVDPARILAAAYQDMRADFSHSKGKHYWREKRRRDFTGLVEHEYGELIDAAEWKRNWETVQAALEGFFASQWPERARRLQPKQWLEIDDNDFDSSAFQLDGVRVFAVPDFAFVEDDGTPVIVDWKTGKPREGYDAQVLGYALYLAQRYGLPLERIRTSLVYLNEGTERPVAVSGEALEGFRQHFGQSVSRMRALLSDVAGNVPHPEGLFPMSEDRSSCARCAYRRVCGRDTTQRADVSFLTTTPAMFIPKTEVTNATEPSI